MIPQKKCIPLRQKSDKLSRKHLLCKRLHTFHLFKTAWKHATEAIVIVQSL